MRGVPTIPCIDACARSLRARLQLAARHAEAKAERMRQEAQVAARLLAERHGATRVWLFGSLAWGQPHGKSDVDLMVEGIADLAWLAAIRTAEEVIDAPVDVVRIEDAPPSLRARVMQEGRLIHERR